MSIDWEALRREVVPGLDSSIAELEKRIREEQATAPLAGAEQEGDDGGAVHIEAPEELRQSYGSGD